MYGNKPALICEKYCDESSYNESIKNQINLQLRHNEVIKTK